MRYKTFFITQRKQGVKKKYNTKKIFVFCLKKGLTSGNKNDI